MDEPPKKRRFWQLHLSTVVALWLLASVVVEPLMRKWSNAYHVYDLTSDSIILIPILFLSASLFEWLVRRCEGHNLFRFNLLTAVTMILAAGVFLGLNSSERLFGPCDVEYLWSFEEPIGKPVGIGYGWPIIYYFRSDPRYADPRKFCPAPLVFDVGFSLISVLCIAIVCEFILRRREARKQ